MAARRLRGLTFFPTPAHGPIWLSTEPESYCEPPSLCGPLSTALESTKKFPPQTTGSWRTYGFGGPGWKT
jgi:hypothetical protein